MIHDVGNNQSQPESRLYQADGKTVTVSLPDPIGEAEIWPMASILRLMTVTVGLATSSKSRGDGGAPVLA